LTSNTYAMHENNSGVVTPIQPNEMFPTPSSSILNTTIPASANIPSRINIAAYYEKLQVAREAMEQSDYHTSHATACDLLSDPDLPVALVVACHVIAGTSVLGQRAIDHFYEAERNAALYMSGEVFNGFKQLNRVLLDGAYKDGNEKEEYTMKEGVEEREEGKETYVEKVKGEGVVEV
jgi:hypothetical protein